jgi:hypothetical protein
MSEKCLILVTSLISDPVQEVNQRRLEDVLGSKGIAFDSVDGSLAENKEVRDTLFQISNQRGKYPQCFIKKADGTYAFVGLWEEVSSFLFIFSS